MQRKIERTKILDPKTYKKIQTSDLSFTPKTICEYLNQFGVIGPDETLNTDNLSQILFSAYLNHFNKAFDIEEQTYIDGYHERIFNLVENLREHTVGNIQLVLEYLYEANAYVLDLVIMAWCLPRQSNYLSEQIYLDRYTSLVSTHNHKLIQIITLKPMEQFCSEAMAKTNHVPLHCIDLLWYYMTPYELEFRFTAGNTSKWVGIHIDETESTESMHTIITINLEYVLSCGLGRVKNLKGKIFEDIIIFMMGTTESIESLKNAPTGKIFYSQYLKIKQSPEKYFGRKIELAQLEPSEDKH